MCLQMCLQVRYYGKRRFCPVCGKSSRRFCEAGQREDARCFRCGTLERHRLVWLYLQKQTDLFDGKSKKMLHFAPEPCLELRLRESLGGNYITADLLDPRAMVKTDITNIEYPDESFNVIYCSHVLEEVPDDRKAMRELYRILKTTGWAILIELISTEKTFEDPSIVEPQDRARAFGLPTNVRKYGPDFVARLREAGFLVETINSSDLVTNEEAVRMGLTAWDIIHRCTKYRLVVGRTCG